MRMAKSTYLLTQYLRIFIAYLYALGGPAYITNDSSSYVPRRLISEIKA
jgi:hypothetical protein